MRRLADVLENLIGESETVVPLVMDCLCALGRQSFAADDHDPVAAATFHIDDVRRLAAIHLLESLGEIFRIKLFVPVARSKTNLHVGALLLGLGCSCGMVR